MTAGKRLSSLTGKMRLENPRGGVPGLHHRPRRDQDFTRKSGSSAKLAKTELPHGRPIIPRVC